MEVSNGHRCEEENAISCDFCGKKGCLDCLRLIKIEDNEGADPLEACLTCAMEELNRPMEDI